MKFILGKKLKMTQKFREDGNVIPVTVVSAGPCYITQVKTKDKDGYQAIQVGFGQAKRLNKPLAGHLKNSLASRFLRELPLAEGEEYQKGQEIKVNIFSTGEKIKVSGISKGKGFQGVVRRHGFHGSPKTHGHKDQLRHSGAIGAGGPQHVFKGMRMGGHMGDERISVTNLEIIEIDADKNLLYIKGAVPGATNGLVEIYAPGKMDLKVPTVETPVLPAVEEIKAEEEVKAEAVANQPVAQEVKETEEPVKVEENSQPTE